MAPAQSGRGGKDTRNGVIALPHVRPLNKSMSVPTQDTEPSWLSRLSQLFKSISSVDSASRDIATREEEASNRMSRVQQPKALQGRFGIGASERQRTVGLSSRSQHHANASHTTTLARSEPTPLKPLVVPTNLQQQHQQTPRLSRLHSLKRMVSGIFGQQRPLSIDITEQTAPVNPAGHATSSVCTSSRPSPSAPLASTPIPSPSAPRVHNVKWSTAIPGPQSSGSSTPVHDRDSAQSLRPRATPTRPRRLSNILAMSDDLPPGMDREVWRIEDYSQLQQIHSGYASFVYKAHCKLSNRTVALKIYHPERLHEISQFQLLREARLHAQLKHPNIIRLYAAFQQEDGVVLVQEYATGGDLLQLLYESGARLSERRTVQVVLEPLLKALLYLHVQSIIHRDIKLENVLFTGKDMTLKLADFGLCLNLREERSVTRAGTLDYMAPEVLKCPTKNLPEDNKERLDLAYNCAVDIWAVGVMAYELINGVPPFTRKDRQETEKLIMQGARPDFQVHASEMAKEFVYSCLTRNSHSRPSAHQLLRFPWIKTATRPNSSQGTFLHGSRNQPLIHNQDPSPVLAHPPAGPSLAARPKDTRFTEAALREHDREHGTGGGQVASCEHGASLWKTVPPGVTSISVELSDRLTTLPGALASPVAASVARNTKAHSLATAGNADTLHKAASPNTGLGPRTAASENQSKVQQRHHAAVVADEQPIHASSDTADQQERVTPPSYDARSSASEMEGAKIRELQYTAALKPRNINDDKHVWLATVDYINQMAENRRTGRQLQHQQAEIYQVNKDEPAAQAPKASLRWQDVDLDDALLGAASCSSRRRVDRTFSDLSRHTTDAGYCSASRSRRNSISSDDDDGDKKQVLDNNHVRDKALGNHPQPLGSFGVVGS